MSVKPPPRWTPRSLTAMFLPHLFRKSRNAAEAIGPFKEKVPLDAHLNHHYIKRKEQHMLKAMRSAFRLNIKPPPDAPKHGVWSIATGKWVPEHLLKLELIFPFSLGPMVAEEVSKRIIFRDARNGMLIPRAVGLAFNEVSNAPRFRSWKVLRERRSFSSSSGSPIASLISLNSLSILICRRD